MNTQIAMEDLISALEGKLPEAKVYDREQLKAHRLACKQAAAARRVYLRDLANLPDAVLGEFNSYKIRDDFPEATSCPMSKVEQLERALVWLRLDRRKTITIEPRDQVGALLEWSATPRPTTVCE